MIISASRRTDIPAFYSDWFMNRLREGFVYVKNPMNPKQISSIPLTPEVVDCIVFWTKNARPMLEQLNEIHAMGYRYYFLFTLTPYDSEMERHLPSKAEIIDGFRMLSKKIGKHRVIWRYDPVIVNEQLTVDYHLHAFEKLACTLSAYTSRCIFSYVDMYPKVRRQAGKLVPTEVDHDDMHKIARGFSDIAGSNHLLLQTCCEEIDLIPYGIAPGACIDREVVQDITGCTIKTKKDRNQRQHCRCVESIDIGAYDCCPHGCVYCYAVSSENAVSNSLRRHDPRSPLLIGWPGTEDTVTARSVKSLKHAQNSLF